MIWNIRCKEWLSTSNENLIAYFNYKNMHTCSDIWEFSEDSQRINIAIAGRIFFNRFTSWWSTIKLKKPEQHNKFVISQLLLPLLLTWVLNCPTISPLQSIICAGPLELANPMPSWYCVKTIFMETQSQLKVKELKIHPCFHHWKTRWSNKPYHSQVGTQEPIVAKYF